MSKLLLYCCKAKPTLYNVLGKFITTKYLGKDFKQDGLTHPELNGKIVAECDFEVEEINYRSAKFVCNRYYLEILKKSCLTDKQMYNYLKGKNGYAIHIKNLHIFDKPKELDFYSSNYFYFNEVEKAPQNMMKVWEDRENPFVLISIQPQWLCKILNREKTIEIRKKVLKEMIK